MANVTVTDQPINYRPGPGGLMPTWGLTVNGLRVGTVWETERGYAGHIEGRNATGEHRAYTCPDLSIRQSVIDRLAEMTGRIGIVEV